MTITDTLVDQRKLDTHCSCVDEGLYSATGQGGDGTQRAPAGGGPHSRSGQAQPDDQGPFAAADPTPESTTLPTPPMAGLSTRAPTPPASANKHPEPILSAPVLADPFLALAADVLDDLERVRIANENRLRQLTRDEDDADGENRGFGLDESHPDVARLAALVDALAQAEHQAELNLRRQLRKHPLGPWVKQARGVGEKQAARLLAAIGDPYINTLHNRPRTVSELWAYCGYHVLRTGHATGDAHSTPAGSALLPAGQGFVATQVSGASGAQAGGNPDHPRIDAQWIDVGVAATRARGQKANWSADAKMRAHLVAVSIVKAGGPYREVYDAARAKHDGALHQVECRRCGPAKKPAQPGSPLSAGHQHARALRAICKAVLRDLWREAKRLHEEALT